VATASCGILVYDADGQCRQANTAAAEIANGGLDGLLSQNYRRLKSWENSGMRRMADEVMADGEPRAGEFHHVSSYGREIWVSCRFSRFEKDGRSHLLVIVTDTTERKVAEELAAWHAVIIESSDYAIISKTLAGIITTWNPGAEKLFGWSAPEAIGRSIEMIIPLEQRAEEETVLAEMNRAPQRRQFEAVRRRKDGSLISIAATLSPVFNRAGDLMGIAKIARDITGQKSLEDQFRQAQKMESIGRLAGGVAHDFNNLLTIISGYSDLLLKETKPDQPQHEFLKEIKKAGERAAALTRQLLAYSRRQLLEPDLVDLNTLVQEEENMLKQVLGADVELSLVPTDNMGRIRVDAGQLEQALMNLAINARDAMPKGGKLTIQTAQVGPEDVLGFGPQDLKPGPYVLLTMTDTGCGMEAATLAHIFEPFFTTKEAGQGTGLGLAMVFGFVKQSGGHICAVSQPGQGCTFKLYFPLVETPAPATEVRPPAPGGKTILLVEDEVDLRKLARRILIRNGYIVLEAADGPTALQLAEQHAGPIDLLVSDMVMPRMDGRQLAERLAAARPGIKVLLMSGYTDDAVMRHGVLNSETAFLQKPFAVEALPAKVRQVMEH